MVSLLAAYRLRHARTPRVTRARPHQTPFEVPCGYGDDKASLHFEKRYPQIPFSNQRPLFYLLDIQFASYNTLTSVWFLSPLCASSTCCPFPHSFTSSIPSYSVWIAHLNVLRTTRLELAQEPYFNLSTFQPCAWRKNHVSPLRGERG